jgi:hypothetical protein
MQLFQTSLTRFTCGFSLTGEIYFGLIEAISDIERETLYLRPHVGFVLSLQLLCFVCSVNIQLGDLRSDILNNFSSFATSRLQPCQFRNLRLENQIFQVHDQTFAEVNSTWQVVDFSAGR